MAIDDRTLKKLRDAMEHSYKSLGTFRKNRRDALKEYVGSHYSDNGADDKVPFNLLELTTGIYVRHLLGGTPRVLITTPHLALRPMAYNFGQALNRLAQQIHLANTFRSVAKRAIFSWGLVKVGLGAYGMLPDGGIGDEIGRPFCDVIDLDDWVHDMTAKDWDHMAFCGHRYRIPYEDFMASSLYKNKDAIKPSERSSVDNQTGDERTEAISRDMPSIPDLGEFEPHIEFFDMWLPRTGQVLTLPVQQKDVVAREVEWEGPESGPYKRLGYCEVEGQILPLPPVALWRDMHQLANGLWRKLERQAIRQKKILGFDPAGVSDAKNIVNANDGDAVKMNANNSKEFSFGGIDNGNLAFLMSAVDQFSWLVGNLDALGGLGPQAETLGQERIIKSSANERVQDMERATQEFVVDVFRDLGLYLWTDPFIEIPFTKRIPGTELELERLWTPDLREGDFLDYNFELHPYSMQASTPGDKLNLVLQIFQQVIVPSMPVMQQQGIGVDFEGLFRLIGRYADLPEIEEVLLANQPVVAPEGPINPRNIRPGTTRRENVRINAPAGTRRGRSAALMQTLLGAGVQNAEMAPLLRTGR